MNNYCEKCNHTGLIPFVKDGKVIPNAFVFCECRLEQDSHENNLPIKPEDFDFPMSDAFRGATYEHCGVPDPGYVPPQVDISSIEDRISDLEAMIAMPGQIPRRYQDRLQQIEGGFVNLRNKVNEVTAKKKHRDKL